MFLAYVGVIPVSDCSVVSVILSPKINVEKRKSEARLRVKVNQEDIFPSETKFSRKIGGYRRFPYPAFEVNPDLTHRLKKAAIFEP